MDRQVKIYVASPLGFTEAGRDFLYSRIIPVITNLGYEVLDPWKLTDPAMIARVKAMPEGEAKISAWRILNTTIGSRNEAAISECTGLVAVLDGVDVDSGTASEVGFAAALRKPIIGYRSDFRSGENSGAMVNLQVEYFVLQNHGRIIRGINDLHQALVDMFGYVKSPA